VLEGVIRLETFPLVEWHYGELADVSSFTVLKTQICVTRPQCVNSLFFSCHRPCVTEMSVLTSTKFTPAVSGIVVYR